MAKSTTQYSKRKCPEQGLSAMGQHGLVRLKTWLLMSAGLCLIAMAPFYWSDQVYGGAFIAIIGAGLLLWRSSTGTSPLPRHLRYTLYTLVAVFSVSTLWQAYQITQHSPSDPLYLIFTLALLFLYPFIVSIVTPFHEGLCWISLHSLIINIIWMLNLSGSFRAHSLILYWLATLMCVLYRLHYQQRQHQLHRQLSRDPETRLFNREQLYDDILREQKRAIREDTTLGFVMLEFSTQTLSQIIETSLKLSQQVAPFEPLYRASPNAMAILLPTATRQTLNERVNSLCFPDHIRHTHFMLAHDMTLQEVFALARQQLDDSPSNTTDDSSSEHQGWGKAP